MKKNKKVKMTFNVPIKIQRQIKNYVEDLGYKSESAFCCEAIEEYLSKLQYDTPNCHIITPLSLYFISFIYSLISHSYR